MSIVDPKYKIEERFVAFIDILGFTQTVEHLEKNETDEKSLKTIKSILNFMDEESIDPNYGTDLPIYQEIDGIYYERELGDPRLSYISDCMIISADPDLNGFKALSRKIHKITADLAFDGIFCRGAITKGKLFHQERVIFGTSYIKAYNLESKLAVFPRVIIDPDILNFFDLTDNKMPLAPAFYGIDNDGIYYQRYWTLNLFPPYAYSFDNYLSIVREHLIKHLTTFKNDSKLLKKYEWLKTEFNSLIPIWERFGYKNIKPV